MSIRLKAAGSVAGTLAIIFGVISLINFLFPAHALMIFSVGIIVYMAWLMYEITLSRMQFEAKDTNVKSDR